MLKRNDRMLAVLLAIALMLACAPVSTPVAAPPTFDILSINTSIASTAQAAVTQTALFITPSLTPTVTPSPTYTPTQTETPTATFFFALPTFTLIPTQITPDSDSKFKCKVFSQTPAQNSTMAKGVPFKASWHVGNLGTEAWTSDNADYRFEEGDKLHLKDAYDFNESVSSGGLTDIIVEMKAPNDPGTYSTEWRLHNGKAQFCTLKLTIVVQ